MTAPIGVVTGCDQPLNSTANRCSRSGPGSRVRLQGPAAQLAPMGPGHPLGNRHCQAAMSGIPPGRGAELASRSTTLRLWCSCPRGLCNSNLIITKPTPPSMSKRRISCGMPMGTFGANLYAPFLPTRSHASGSCAVDSWLLVQLGLESNSYNCPFSSPEQGVGLLPQYLPQMLALA